MKEIEILIEIKSDKQTALKALSRFPATPAKHTLDIYYSDPLRTNLQPDADGKLTSSFRIRQQASKNTITYKVDHFNNGIWSYSDEHETHMESFEIMEEIIKNLGLTELIRINNERHTFTTPDYEIVLDDVTGLGLYLEIEYRKQVRDDEVEQVKIDMRTFLQKLGIEFGAEQHAGKPELSLRKKKEISN